jgi:hypothetical protein
MHLALSLSLSSSPKAKPTLAVAATQISPPPTVPPLEQAVGAPREAHQEGGGMALILFVACGGCARTRRRSTRG